MLICTLGGLIAWFVIAVPLAIIKFDNLYLSLSGYLVLLLTAFYFLTVSPKQKALHIPLKYSVWQKIGRAIFAGSIITLAVFLSKTLGPFWGGIFSIFPAVFLSTLTIVYWHYDSLFLFKMWKNAPIGSVIFTLYPITAIYTFPAFGIWGGTFASYSICLLLFFALRKFYSAKDGI